MPQLNENLDFNNARLEVTDNHVHINFSEPVEILSSAILNGGFTRASNIVNVKVGQNKNKDSNKIFPPPEVTLQQYIKSKKWEGSSVGIMTAANMKSFRTSREVQGSVIVQSFITLGVSNARRAGDTADWKSFNSHSPKPGTINIILGTNARLSKAAMVEAIMIISEAKTCVMQDFNILSSVSGKTATGTGTDSCVVFTGTGENIDYCGKHVLMGEMVAKAVLKALKDSLSEIVSWGGTQWI
ncbi:adenosylcobinamide amidohydrolase [Clostridium luticellarii]|uniref:Adenosylcobinamide amidohydrolase n=1 Tax=Clostridium luticellarii TaxID=1691940 RepID=A0A2T0BRY2_9CLOT|nr:adenosylcobinamide amidohydrolase [Clostridium luticellarii]MCI1943661.1 adenosylcobinamide amidohydrolase [Clostridium luticellarii]MCI1968912.1 adenosylcobinamide amidohydrolase [Clostridium luticellarii]MCI1994289.1 adenosylcobinamide amidohydrolase [Clostridium luticellarii]MCI2038758.1 adenosylcobinamide amidohydrolase [Clostridium luticellarii]PRR86633.1 Adenosylcobinamide amidohydrolase [Clostridium luticellarii]